MPTTIGRYAILRKLGQGGMGAVYEAEHLRLEKRVALKVLPREVANDPAAIARFDREMKAISRVTHPGIIQALDADEADGVRYLAMELVDGYDVSEVAAYYEERAGKPIPLSVACEIIRQAAIAIQAAHDAGLVHRDLKPSNLMLGKDGTVKVLDLGLAMLDSKHSEEGGLTSTGQVMGTVDYMAPEQAAETRSVDSRADVYSLGATLYRLIAGKGPYPNDRFPSVIQKLMALANTNPTPLKELRAKCPAKLVALVELAMAKDPGERLPTAAELANALEPAGDRDKLVELAGKMPKRKPVDRSLLAETQIGSSIVDARGPVPDPTETRAGAETDNNAEATFVEATQSLGSEIPSFSVDETPNTLVGSSSGTSWSRKKKPPIPLWGWIAGGVATLGIVIAVVSSSGSSAPPPSPKSLVLQPIESNDDVSGVVPSAVPSTNTLNIPGVAKAPLGFWGDSDSFDEPTVNTESTSTETTLQFSELEDTVVIPTLLDETDALTIELWMQRDSRLINAHTHIVGFDSQVVIGTDDVSALAFKSGGSMLAGTPESTATELGLPRPIHVAGVRDPIRGEVRLYVDGKFVSHKTGKAALGIDALEIASAQYQWMSGDGPSENHFRGWIGELRVSNSVRYTGNFIPQRLFMKDGNTLALYHFNEGAGDSLFDSSGNGHDGKIIGATWVKPKATAPGTAGTAGGFRDGGQRSSSETALRFTELEHNVRVPTLFDESPALTIEAWLQRDRLHANAHSNIMGFGSGSIIGTGAIGELSFRMRYGEDVVSPRSFNPAGYGDPAHVACVRDSDSGELRLFIDGKLAGVTDAATYHPLAKGDDDYNYFEICSVAHQWGSDRGSKAPYFSGWFDEVRISKSARYKNEFEPERRFESDSDTLALYHFEEGSGDILKDASGNGHDGTIVGAKWVTPSPAIDVGRTTAMDLLSEQGPIAMNRAEQRTNGSWSSIGKSIFEFDRPVRNGYTLTALIKQSGGYDMEVGLVLPIGDAQVELIIPDHVRGKKNAVVLSRVAGKQVSTGTASFPKGRSFRVVADVRRVNDAWHLYAKLDDEIIVNRDLDESKLSVDDLATLSGVDRIGIRFSGGSELDLESADVVMHSD